MLCFISILIKTFLYKEKTNNYKVYNLITAL